MSCESNQIKYYVSKGSKSEKEKGTCGIGCFCLDKNVDKESVDKINKTKNIYPASFCDSHHSSAIGHEQGQSLFIFRTKNISRKK